MNDDLTSLRLQEVGGAVNTDCTFEIGGEWVMGNILKKKYLQRAEWNGTALQLTRRHDSQLHELILTRFLTVDESGSREMRLTSVHRDLLTGVETESSSIFKPVT